MGSTRVAVAMLLSLSAHASADSPAAPTKKVRVAVVSGLAVNVDTARADALAQDLSESLASELEIEAIGGLEVRRKLPEALPPDCVNTPACVTDVGKKLAVDQLLFVVFVDSGTLQVDSTWIEVATGRSIARAPIDVVAGSDPKAKFALSATQLLPDAKVRVKSTTTIIHEGGVGGTMSAEIPRHFTTVTYATAALTVVGVGVGLGFGLDARSHYNSCESSLTCASGARDGIRHVALAADVSYLIALGAAVTTAVLWATSGSESHLVIAPDEHGAMVGAFGRF